MNGKTFQRPFEFWWKEFQFEINEVIHLQTLKIYESNSCNLQMSLLLYQLM